ncbi:MAG TPA: protein kinase, partial [Isosphaeraceae bacterium]|nr:protein kinase [Isosphaeraceae bacterium]
DKHADDPSSRQRFLLEAEVTGRLEHPGIVPVYGLGHDAAGRPFYAMRYVRGDTLAEVIQHFHEGAGTGPKKDWRGVAFRKLLGQILDVCNVIAYAHSKGVIHRDLKPRNIMVGPFGETLVLDWGLAKQLSQPDGPLDSVPGPWLFQPGLGFARTSRGSAVGTPEFMSPEQAAGASCQVGPASDVYSLGATLYCLLTGRSPFRNADLDATMEQVRRGTFTVPRAIDPTIPRPLEAIVLKAMALDPPKRYASPRALAEDLEKWLADEPVSAWREPWSVKARRATARHRTLVTTGLALSFLAVVALGVFVAYQRRSNELLAKVNLDLQQANERGDRARTRAEEQVELLLRAVEHFHRVVAQNLDVKNRPELNSLRKELLQAPRDFYRVLIERIQNNPESQPETLAKLADALLALAQITASIDSEAEAVRLNQKAIAVLDQLARDHPTAASYRLTLAAALATQSLLEQSTGQPQAALASIERARDLYEGLVRDDPADERYQFGLAQVELRLGLLRREQRPDHALASYGRAQVSLQDLVRDHPSNDNYQAELGQVLRNLGVLYRALGKPKDALASYEQARSIFQRLVDDHRAIVHYRKGLADCFFNLGNLHGIDLLTHEGPLRNYQAASAIQEDLVREQPSVAEYRAALAHTYGQIAAYPFLVEPAERLGYLERARKLLLGLVRDNPEVIRYRADLALTHYLIGDRQRSLHRCTQALASLELARELAEKLARDDPNNLSSFNLLGAVWKSQADILADEARYEDAAHAYQQAIQHQRLAFDKAGANALVKRDAALELVRHHENLARIEQTLNRPRDSLESLRRARAVLAQVPSPSRYEHHNDAQLYARICALLSQNQVAFGAAERVERDGLAGLAMAALRKAAAAGLSVKTMQEDRALDPLRGRADFQLLVMDLAFPHQPFQP